MPDEFTVLPMEVNHRFLLAREEVTAALKALADANGAGTDAQYQALADARHKIAQVYREARAVDNGTALDQTLWFALDEAALWQDQEAARYGLPSGEVRASGSPSE
ncbi:MAG TPA: hypothetical protein VG247_06345 [Pseudonocardiaceae bacterium]|jgi:hypothetical protein|nr:hypothetical protein [Pseudonocardiaceae bacterium]